MGFQFTTRVFVSASLLLGVCAAAFGHKAEITPLPVLKYVALETNAVIGSYSVAGKVKFDIVAPLDGEYITMGSTNPKKARVPATVFMPEGSKLKGFNVRTSTVLADENVTISATFNGVTKTADLLITTGGLTLLIAPSIIYPTSITPGSGLAVNGLTDTITAYLSSPNPAAGTTFVEVSSSDSFTLNPLGPIVIPAGQRTGFCFFSISAPPVIDIPVTIKAQLGNSIRLVTVTVKGVAGVPDHADWLDGGQHP